MICRQSSSRWAVSVLLVVVVAGLAATPARAQFDGGWGWGLGYQTPAVVQSIYSRSNIQAASAAAAKPRALTAPARAPRDVTFFDRYDPETRWAMEARVARRPPPMPPSMIAADQTKPAPSIPARIAASLMSFFNSYDEIVWPTDAPTEGDLLAKRSVSDESSRSVLKEYRTVGLAKVATVTDARNKLLDYGRPALQYVRTNVPAVADSFHAFLLSLYDALARSATEPYKPPTKP